MAAVVQYARIIAHMVQVFHLFYTKTSESHKKSQN